MGNKNDYFCCSAAETHPSAIYDIDSLVFRHLDFNKAETYKKLEKVAQEFTTKEGIAAEFVPLVSRIIANKQEHLLEAYRLLPNADDKKRFIKSVEYVDIELVDSVVAWLRQLFHNLVKNPTTSKSTLMNIKACNYLDADILRAERKQELFNRGLQTLSQGKVGLLLLCGGKNKRFGGTTKFLKPLNISSKKSTMDLMFDRLKALFPLAKCEWSLRVFMVCSQQNYAEIKAYMEAKHYYDIGNKNVMFFLQSTIPILNMKGELCLADDLSVIESSNGCGEFLQSILNFKMKNKIIDEMGVKYLWVSGMENVLERPCDPLLLGVMLNDNSDVVAKCVDAYNEAEDFYRYVSVNNRLKSFSTAFIYADAKALSEIISADQQKLRRSPITMNSVVYDTGYLNKLLSNPQLRFEISRMYRQRQLRFHVDKRNFSYVDVRDNKALHSEQRCYIFEKHLADLFIASDQITLIKVPRDEQFAPLLTRDEGDYSIKASSDRLLDVHKQMNRCKQNGKALDISFSMFTDAEVQQKSP